jgi:O-antigen/teichoic acid export membrane protein
MNVDTLEPLDVREFEKTGWLTAITGPVLALELRFPLVSKGFLSIFDQGIFSGTSFLTAILIGRASSPDQLGIYYLLISILLFISGVQEQLVAAPYIVYSKRLRGQALAEYAGSMWAHYAIVTLLAVVGLLTAIAALTIAGRSEIVQGLWPLVFAEPMLLFRQWIRRFTLANLNVKSTIAFDAAVSLLQLGSLVALVYFDKLSLFRIFAVMGGAGGLACAGWYVLARPRLQFVPSRFWADWRDNWGFSKWALQTYVLGNTTPQLMVWLISATIGAAATGVYGACSNLIGMGYVILCGVDNVLTPQAAHAYATGGPKELRRVLLIAGAFMALAMGGLCAFLLVTGDWLVVAAFGAQYHGTGPILITLALAAAMTALSNISGNGLWAIDQPRLNFLADVCGMTVTLIAAASLMFSFGALGAALAALAGATSAAVVRTLTVVRYLSDGALDSSLAIDAGLSS